MDKPDFEQAPTAPCGSLDASVTTEVVEEVRKIVATMPTSEWRRSVRERLSTLEGAVKAWDASAPSDDERRRVTAAALDFLSEVIEPHSG